GHNLYLAADAGLPGATISGGARSHSLAGTEIGMKGFYKSLSYPGLCRSAAERSGTCAGLFTGGRIFCQCQLLRTGLISVRDSTAVYQAGCGLQRQLWQNVQRKTL
ncbi:hypothetical protein ABN09_02930, partial [Morganella morganii]